MAEPEAVHVALTVAGSDSGGGAGIQADLETFQLFGVYGATAVTLATAQNTLGVREVELLPPEFVARQIGTVAEDFSASFAVSMPERASAGSRE